MFVFLVLAVQGHFQSLARQLAARERAQAHEHLADRLVAAAHELGAVVVLRIGRPGLHQRGKVVNQQVGHHVQVLAAAVGVGGLAVHEVFKVAVAWARLGQILPPQEELDGVPAGGNVLFATALVLGREVLLGDGELAVVDQASAGLALHAVHKGFVHGPGVDAAFGAVVVVNGATVKAEGLGLAIELARSQPLLAGFGQGLSRRLGSEGQHRLAQRLGAGQGVGVVCMHQGGVVRCHGLRGHRLCGLGLGGGCCRGLCCGAGAAGEGGGAQGRCQQRCLQEGRGHAGVSKGARRLLHRQPGLGGAPR